MAKGKVASREYVLDADGKEIGIRFSFGAGKVHEVFFAELVPDLQHHAMAHGFNQTLGDAFSQAKGDSDVAEALFLARWETLKGGEWGKRGSGGGSVQADLDLAKALAEVTKRPLEEAQERVREEDEAWKKARRKHPAVAEVLARLAYERKAEKAEQAEVSTEDLL